MNTTFTTTDLTRLLVLTLGQLERVTAAARVVATQKEQALAMARTLQRQRDQAEADIEHWKQMAEGSENVARAYFGELELTAEELGAECIATIRDEVRKLEAELKAARVIIATLRQHHDAGGEVWGSIDQDFAAYDEAVKARAV